MKDDVLSVKNLTKWFPLSRGPADALFRRQHYVRAVDKVSFHVEEQEILGLIGESGCGKTTTARMVVRLVDPTDGKVWFKGTEIFSLKKRELKHLRKQLQMVFQDPYESLNPRMTIFDLLAEPATVHDVANNMSERRGMVYNALEEVELTPPEDFISRYPHQLSGGQRQRVAIARSLILQPSFLVADEPVSMLDASVKAGVLALFLKFRDKLNLTQLFITHDLAVTRHICTRIIVMYLGQIVESGPTADVIDDPMHPYVKALIAAVPVPDPTADRVKLLLSGELSSSIEPPVGCRLHPRCAFVMKICKEVEPPLEEIKKNHYVACHLFHK